MKGQFVTDASAEVRVSVRQASELLEVDERTVRRWANAGKLTATRDTTDRRAPFLILLSSLPESAQKKHLAEQAAACVACNAQSTQLVPVAEPATAIYAGIDPRYQELWAWYGKLGTDSKQQAESALAAAIDFHNAHDAGVSVGMATAAVTVKYGISESTLRRYRKAVDGHPRGYWLPLLAPRYCGNGKDAEFTEEAWEWILSRHLTQTEIKTTVLVRRAREAGAGKGWQIPSTKTVNRRLKDEAAPLVILGRKGPKALEASFPTVEKDWASVPLHEMWESDGCFGIVLVGNGEVYRKYAGKPDRIQLLSRMERVEVSTGADQYALNAGGVRAIAEAWGVAGAKALALSWETAQKPGSLRILVKIYAKARRDYGVIDYDTMIAAGAQS